MENVHLTEALAKISAQQGEEDTPVWMAGEQLKDMLRAEPHLAEMVSRDLDIKEMSLAKCEAKIKAWADKHRKGNFACVTPMRAEAIIREFYGLPARGAAVPKAAAADLIDLADFFR